MKILVTGAAGFVGSWMVSELSSRGHEVVGSDLYASPGILPADITDLSQVISLFEQSKPDCVVHLAAISGTTGKNEIEQSLRQCYLNFNVNVNGTTNVCEACRKTGVGKIIYMSSFAVYGKTSSDRLPITPQTPVSLAHAYATSKYMGELVVKNYSEDFGIKSAIFRTPFVVGGRQKEKNVVREFIESAMADEELIIFGKGEHVREFIHPIDLVGAFESALRRFDKIDDPCELFVLGNIPVKIKDLAHEVIRQVGRGTVKHAEASVDRVFDQFSDYSKASQLLSWRPGIQIRTIIEGILASDYPKRSIPSQHS